MISDDLSVLAGQVLIVGYPAGPLPDSLSAMAARNQLGGFILFKRNLTGVTSDGGRTQRPLAELAEQNRALIAACANGPGALPPILSVDQEGGRVQRLGPPVLQLPPMRALGAHGDLALTRTCGRVLGAQLKALGFSLDFAPVLDVDSNPDNPVIGDRSFSADPHTVVRHGRAFALGLGDAGIAACGKHFPGHGDTALDSHFALPRVPKARDELGRTELLPFAEAHAACPSIMTAHVVFDALDPARPATLSPTALSVLREQLGYRGLIVSDDLEMGAIADHYDVGEAAVAAITAGCDALLVCSDPARAEHAHRALVEQAARDSALRARLAQAAERCRALRARYRAAPAPELLRDGAFPAKLADEANALQNTLQHALNTHS